MRTVITLTTDFGNSPYVGQLKGVLLGLVPTAQIVDITHEIQPQNIMQGAIAIADSVPYFPAGTIHIAVVDPGVGTQRPLVAIQLGDWFLIGPDNGLLSTIAESFPPKQIVELNRAEHFLPNCSRTFHGRDIMAPVAARIANGFELAQLGSRRESLHKNLIPSPNCSDQKIAGVLLVSDSFGNLISNIRRADLSAQHCDNPRVWLPEFQCFPRWTNTYAEADDGECIALIGSSNRVEIAIVNGNASKVFVMPSTSIELTW